MSETTTTNEDQSVFSDILDGAQGVIGMKSDVTLDNWGKRIGAMVIPATAGVFAQGFATRSALQKIDRETANKVVAAIPGGAVTVRKV